MTNRSANNKSRRRPGIRRVDNRGEAEVEGRVRGEGRRNIEYASRSPRFRQPAKSRRSGRNISSEISDFRVVHQGISRWMILEELSMQRRYLEIEKPAVTVSGKLKESSYSEFLSNERDELVITIN